MEQSELKPAHAHLSNRQIVYLMSGPAHIPYLLISLQSLRQHWNGEIVVYAWPESYPLVCEIQQCTDFGIQVREREPDYRGKNAQFADKISLMRSLDCEVGLYLDADTIINGKLDPLFEAAEAFGFAATQFNDWKIGGSGIVRARIARLFDVKEIEEDTVRYVLNYCCHKPSVNGGVLACCPMSVVLPLWYDWTMAGRSLFIADETVLHVLQYKFDSEMIVVGNHGSFNTSPKYKSSQLQDGEVVVWHGHGDCWTRPDKSPKGFEMWWPLYEQALELNLGNILHWRDRVHNKWIDALEQTK